MANESEVLVNRIFDVLEQESSSVGLHQEQEIDCKLLRLAGLDFAADCLSASTLYRCFSKRKLQEIDCQLRIQSYNEKTHQFLAFNATPLSEYTLAPPRAISFALVKAKQTNLFKAFYILHVESYHAPRPVVISDPMVIGILRSEPETYPLWWDWNDVQTMSHYGWRARCLKMSSSIVHLPTTTCYIIGRWGHDIPMQTVKNLLAT